jgi:Tol biopolymer transport system component
MNCVSASRVFLFWTSAPRWYFEKAVIFKSKKNWNDQNLYLLNVVLNYRLVVEKFLETMELWHVQLL